MPVWDQRHSHRRDTTRYPTLGPAARRSRTLNPTRRTRTRSAIAPKRAAFGVDTSPVATGIRTEHHGARVTLCPSTRRTRRRDARRDSSAHLPICGVDTLTVATGTRTEPRGILKPSTQTTRSTLLGESEPSHVLTNAYVSRSNLGEARAANFRCFSRAGYKTHGLCRIARQYSAVRSPGSLTPFISCTPSVVWHSGHLSLLLVLYFTLALGLARSRSATLLSPVYVPFDTKSLGHW